MSARLIAAVVLTLCCWAPASHALQPDERVGVGTVLEIRVVTPNGLRQKQIFRVDGLGFIVHPLAGKVRIAQLAPAQIETMLERVIEQGGVAEPAVRVFVIEPSPGEAAVAASIRVSGEVRKPGAYDYVEPTNLQQAIQAAGGLRSKGEDRLIRIKRKGKTTKNLRLSSSGDYALRAGDEIIVLGESFR